MIKLVQILGNFLGNEKVSYRHSCDVNTRHTILQVRLWSGPQSKTDSGQAFTKGIPYGYPFGVYPSSGLTLHIANRVSKFKVKPFAGLTLIVANPLTEFLQNL